MQSSPLHVSGKIRRRPKTPPACLPSPGRGRPYTGTRQTSLPRQGPAVQNLIYMPVGWLRRFPEFAGGPAGPGEVCLVHVEAASAEAGKFGLVPGKLGRRP